MKRQICITLDEETHHKIQRKLSSVNFRSKSHFIEVAVKKFLDETSEKKNEVEE